jgi:hypothetical protein
LIPVVFSISDRLLEKQQWMVYEVRQFKRNSESWKELENQEQKCVDISTKAAFTRNDVARNYDYRFVSQSQSRIIKSKLVYGTN